MIRVLVAEDSPVAQQFLVHILSSDNEIQIVGTASDGDEAVEAVKRLKPHVITMDINMPKMNGYQATRRIMESNPTPIVMVTASYDQKEAARTFKALEAGAVTIIRKPEGIGHPDYEASTKELIQTVKMMSEVKVILRLPHLQRSRATAPATAVPEVKPKTEIKIVAIGTSTGGPVVVQTILSGLPVDFPLPVLIVQHIADGFVGGYSDWLARTTGFPVSVASHGDAILPGHAYVAPSGWHMGVRGNGRIVLSSRRRENDVCPSISHLFHSVVGAFGVNAIGILLTGMGKDGAAELKQMKDMGATTIVQDEASSVVHGMPGEAIKISAATYVLAPEKIAALLASLVKGKSKGVDQNECEEKER